LRNTKSKVNKKINHQPIHQDECNNKIAPSERLKLTKCIA
jgi:hypothetical protein